MPGHRNDTRLSEIPKQNTLADLPIELLLSIADFLLLVDVICLSLCNRRLFATFHLRNHFILPSGIEKHPPFESPETRSTEWS
ncbi:hypothetical protein N7463_006451 [Penicillium fimorum]|uniref:F-box domain-containing protein n=1 Tax=Penicillium fimorum TaxID=1882269 RepID=A0A9W9XUG9_9EURO|nr:hypothetical protein N7463_006451 [Penicillium fimorum]